MQIEKLKYDAIDGQTKVRFKVLKQEQEVGFVEASRAGIQFGGNLVISDRNELNVLAKLIGDAWKAHRSLLPTLVTSASGH